MTNVIEAKAGSMAAHYTPPGAVAELERSAGLLNGRAAARLSRAIAQASLMKAAGPRRGPLQMGLMYCQGFVLALTQSTPEGIVTAATVAQARAQFTLEAIRQSDAGLLAMSAGWEAGEALVAGTCPPTARNLPLSDWRMKAINLRRIIEAGLASPGAMDDKAIGRS